MLGSRFDFEAKLDELVARRADADRRDEARREESCVELERAMAMLAKTVHADAKTVHADAKTVHAGTETKHARPDLTRAFRCPVCDDFMRVGGESELSEFAGLDVKLHRLQCDTCGMLTGRVYHPSVGYHDRLVR